MNEPLEIVIVMDGGVIHGVISPVPLKYILVDQDTEGAPIDAPDIRPTPHGDMAHVRLHDADVDAQEVYAYSQIARGKVDR